MLAGVQAIVMWRIKTGILEANKPMVFFSILPSSAHTQAVWRMRLSGSPAGKSSLAAPSPATFHPRTNIFSYKPEKPLRLIYFALDLPPNPLTQYQSRASMQRLHRYSSNFGASNKKTESVLSSFPLVAKPYFHGGILTGPRFSLFQLYHKFSAKNIKNLRIFF